MEQIRSIRATKYANDSFWVSVYGFEKPRLIEAQHFSQKDVAQRYIDVLVDIQQMKNYPTFDIEINM